ncbi:hypothetical protein BT93_L1374 [Corymbia citriodora subsp. variegata]|uniref:Uncharacterized protein n=1 Tax=Corymbia citriodora subsp. variegata TaxID=360336 RepID=A0A8T0CMR9_CORYI|nr:hypothetical protein BT93_L1374 [Corymbia citriodora subsp. variegata]
MKTIESSRSISRLELHPPALVSKRVFDNGTIKGDVVPPLVLLIYKRHINLGPLYQRSSDLCFAPSS